MDGALVTSVAPRMLLAAVFGAAMGLQRELVHRPAGLRTHMLVSVAACAFAESASGLQLDRVIPGVATGIGFLGAGAIVRQGLTPTGLTTAASIWVAAAVGVATGMNNAVGLLVAIVATLITVAALQMPDWRVASMARPLQRVELVVTFDAEVTSAEAIRKSLAREFNVARIAGRISFTRKEGKLMSTTAFEIAGRDSAELWSGLARFGESPGIAGIDAN